MATATAIIPSDEKADGLRLLSLVIDGGTTVLRYRFDQCIPTNDLQNKLNNPTVRGKLNSMRKGKVLTTEQWKVLYPMYGQPNSADFDISLLACLLRYICGLDEQSPMWTCIPPSFNTSVEADITRLRQCRNEMSHMKSTHLTQQEFQQKWGDMEQIILRLGNGIPDLSENIQSLKEENIDPAKELQLLETLKEWEERDKILAIEMEKVNVRLDEMGNEVDQIKDSVIAQNKKKTESENELKNQGRMLDIMAAKELDTENRMSTLNIEVSDLGNKISSIQEKQNTLDLKAEEGRKNLTVEHEKLYDRLDKTESKTKEIESAVLDIKLKVTEDKKYKYEDVSSN
ncbi:E3 ubiquitin-protein ligase DZIP3-like [Mercenaria mercenaria]|uniref:E3 ubiquitin-protein ligase DZIP3-like n=1 Tax=Mercenaria mercenaria TaxID=6596 RepID=UPI00234EEE9D|nr:E3 ubiquitin-protein ligase DZIP3-like [Mercenaria mercenaria]